MAKNNRVKKTKWQKTAVEAYCTTPRKNGKVQWSKIASAVEKVHGNVFAGIDDVGEYLRGLFRTKKMQGLVKGYTLVAATTSTTPTPATSAHVNDDDRDTESESEVVRIEGVEEKTNKDGTKSKAVDILTARDMTNLTERQIMELLGYDPENFVLVSSSCRRGTWQMVSTEDGIVDLMSYRVNGNVRPRQPEEVDLETVERTLREIVDGKTVLPAPTIIGEDASKIAILSVADLHLGKLAWAPECGESYDHKIATKRFNHIISSSIERLKKESGIEKIVFFWAQDFFHFDTPQVTTTAGTRQDTDVRWQKMFDYGTKMLLEAVLRLREIAPVETFYVRSNHDTQTAYYAAHVLEAYFHDYPDVSVDVSAAPRKYIQYGVNLFGFGHGDKEGKRIFSMMPIERPVEWGRTKNHEFFLGHFHSLRTYEDGGVIIRYLSSPTGTDAWHCEEGFLGAQKAAQLFIRGKSVGQIAEYTINVQ